MRALWTLLLTGLLLGSAVEGCTQTRGDPEKQRLNQQPDSKSVRLIGAPLQFKVARVITAIRAKSRATGLKSLSKEEVIQALGQEFGSGAYGSTGVKEWAARMNIAKLAYPRLLQGKPGLGVSAGALAIQGFCFFAPLVLIVWSLQQPESQPLMRQTAAEQKEIEKQAANPPESAESKTAREEFMARYDAETDPAAKWTMLETDDEDESLNFVLDPAWVDQQHTALMDQLPPDHTGKLWYLLEKTNSSDPRTAEIILSVISRITSGDARQIAELDEDHYALLMNAYQKLAKAAAPDVLAGQTATLDALWAGMETPDKPNAAHKSQLASIRARIAFKAGRFDDAETWMDRYVASSGVESKYATFYQGWFMLDIGQPDRALVLATNAIGKSTQPNPFHTNWQTLAGWAEMARGHPREADAYFQAALDGQAALRKKGRDTLPWWLRLMTTEIGANSSLPINAQSLDHLAALEGYAPEEAGRVRAILGKKATPEWIKNVAPYFNSTFDGWGQARETAHAKIIKALEFSQKNTAASTGAS